MDQFTPRDTEVEERRDDERPEPGRPAPRRIDAGPDPTDHDVITVKADEGEGEARKPPMPSRWLFVGVAVLLAGLLAWGGYGYWKRSTAADETQRRQAEAVPAVRVVKAAAQDAPVDLTLPGETQAFASSNIFPRATGYVVERRADIGTRVKKGDLLLHIAAPDLDQQLAQAEAQLGQVEAAALQAQANVSQAEANLNLAKVNLSRAEALVGKGFETLQNRDQLQANQTSQAANLQAAQAGVKVAQANIKAQQATIDRLRALAAFEDVRAPFDGIVTARNVDVGNLVNADAATGSPIFTIDEDDVLRVNVQVPQNAATGIRDGLEARIAVPQMPGRTFIGTVTRNSGALLSTARTLTVEVDIPNQSGALRSGLYTYVSLAVPRQHPDVVLPSESLIFDQDGTHVAVVGDGSKVRMVPVRITRDFGTSFEVDLGPKAGEAVITNPPATLREGAAVKVEDDKGGGAGGTGGGEKTASNGGAGQ